MRRNQNFQLYMMTTFVISMHRSDGDIVSYELTKGRKRGKNKRISCMHGVGSQASTLGSYVNAPRAVLSL